MATPKRARCIYTYEATDNSQITVEENEIVEIETEDDSGWFFLFFPFF